MSICVSLIIDLLKLIIFFILVIEIGCSHTLLTHKFENWRISLNYKNLHWEYIIYESLKRLEIFNHSIHLERILFFGFFILMKQNYDKDKEDDSVYDLYIIYL